MSGAAAWVDALHALALFVVDPIGLGGIAVRAGAGPVRDRFMALLNETLPPGTPVHRLPLHAGDDRLLGGLDLAATLRVGKPVSRKGLLAEADGGIVVLAMAERIEAGTAARLRAALDDGTVSLQRDGLSAVLPARFGIVALDEGVEPDERTPSPLLDRLAFHVDLTEVSWRHAADSLRPDPDHDSTECADGAEALCHAAWALGIDSIRAPLLALRAARAAAARDARSSISECDLELAARLVLGPRATRLPPPEADARPEEPATEPAAEPAAEPAEEPTVEPDETTSGVPDEALADLVLEAAKANLPADLLAQLARSAGDRTQAPSAGRVGQTKDSVKRGRPVGTRQGEPRNGARLHLLETLKAAAPWQTLRGRTDRFMVRRDDFRIVRFRQHTGTTAVFAVDASGSAAMNRLAEAKGAVELLIADCYVRRDQVALVAFRGKEATVLLPPTGSLLRAKRCLASLPGGGPTPLAAGIEAATVVAASVRRAGRTPLITLLTDAHANITRDGTAERPRAEAEAMDAARVLAGWGMAALLVDTSLRQNPFARRLAAEMHARYVPLPYADATALSRVVRAAGA